MINVNHKIKCTHEGTPILCYIKKQHTQKKTKTIDCKLGMRIITFHLGKPMRGFLASTHCHDKNNYVQTARSLIAVKSFYTERCYYPIKYARDGIPRVYSTEQ